MNHPAVADVQPPPDRFNFAQHLLQLNTGRAAKAAFVDDHGTLSYGQLSHDLTYNIGGLGETEHGLGVAIVGTLAWCAIIVVPGWLRFLRGDLK